MPTNINVLLSLMYLQKEINATISQASSFADNLPINCFRLAYSPICYPHFPTYSNDVQYRAFINDINIIIPLQVRYRYGSSQYQTYHTITIPVIGHLLYKTENLSICLSTFFLTTQITRISLHWIYTKQSLCPELISEGFNCCCL